MINLQPEDVKLDKDLSAVDKDKDMVCGTDLDLPWALALIGYLA